jgi:hypothetical protein
VKPVDSFFGGFFGRDHVLAEENRGLPAFAQGYGGQAADVTNRKSGERARPACWFRRRAETGFPLNSNRRDSSGS